MIWQVHEPFSLFASMKSITVFFQKCQKDAGFLLCQAKDCLWTNTHRGGAVTGAVVTPPPAFTDRNNQCSHHESAEVWYSRAMTHWTFKTLRKAQKELMVSHRNIHNSVVFRCSNMRKFSSAMKSSNSMGAVMLKVPSWLKQIFPCCACLFGVMLWVTAKYSSQSLLSEMLYK